MKSKPKLLILLPGSDPFSICGVGAYTKHLILRLKEDNHYKIYLICHQGNGRTLEGIDTFQVNNPWNHPRNALKVVNTIKKIRPNVIHLQYTNFSQGIKGLNFLFFIFLSSYKLFNQQTRVIITLHEQWIDQVYGLKRKILNTMYKYSVVFFMYKRILFDACLASTSHRLQLIKKARPDFKAKLGRIPSNFEDTYQEAKNPLSIPESIFKKKFILLNMGLPHPRRNYSLILESVKKAMEGGISLWMVFVGPISQSPEKYKEVQDKIKVLGLESSVLLTGAVDEGEMAFLLNHADAYINICGRGLQSPSGSQVAALAKGIPILSNKSTEDLGYFIHEKNCLTFTKHNPEEIAHCIDRLAREPEFRNQIGSSGKTLYQKDFSWNQQIRLHKEIYET